MTKSFYCRAATLFAFLVASHAVKAGTNLVANGSFEANDGSFAGWSLSNDIEGNIVYSGFGSTEGDYAGTFGQAPFFGPVVLSQTIATVPGATYDFSFDLGSSDLGTEDDANAFAVSFGSVDVPLGIVAKPPDFVHYAYSAVASSSTTTLSFSLDNDVEFFLLDDVQINPVPEPASFAALGIGLLALRRRR